MVILMLIKLFFQPNYFITQGIIKENTFDNIKAFFIPKQLHFLKKFYDPN